MLRESITHEPFQQHNCYIQMQQRIHTTMKHQIR